MVPIPSSVEGRGSNLLPPQAPALQVGGRGAGLPRPAVHGDTFLIPRGGTGAVDSYRYSNLESYVYSHIYSRIYSHMFTKISTCIFIYIAYMSSTLSCFRGRTGIFGSGISDGGLGTRPRSGQGYMTPVHSAGGEHGHLVL